VTGPWKIRFKNVHPTKVGMSSTGTTLTGDPSGITGLSITSSYTELRGDYQAFIFELENTAGMTSTLELRPKDIKITSTKKDYDLAAGTLVGADGKEGWWIFSDITRASVTVELPGDGTAVASFSSGRYRIDVSAGSVAELRLAFQLPSGVDRYELRWPELPSMRLGDVAISTPTPFPRFSGVSPVKDIYMTDTRDPKIPGPRITQFPAGTKEVFIYFELDWSLTTVNPEITLHIVDVYERECHRQTLSYKANQHIIDTGSACYFHCSFDWQAGSYRTDVFIGGLLERSWSWTVE
jgi:hypothetical protein